MVALAIDERTAARTAGARRVGAALRAGHRCFGVPANTRRICDDTPSGAADHMLGDQHADLRPTDHRTVGVKAEVYVITNVRTPHGYDRIPRNMPPRAEPASTMITCSRVPASS